ncbi:hypothetical protein [Amycolatopsis kentuckyensis]|uniref:hypothetical protein n=1 Tax=Amycolatopsis kentuckyensis TaxID=218823 RepID=UPI0013020CD9|nr:hypothetical protein [Amycolatopsis kentuckyensis]
MSPIDHLIVTVLGARRARAGEPRPTPAPARDGAGRQGPKSPSGRRSAAPGTA